MNEGYENLITERALLSAQHLSETKLPMVELFQTVEGEGTRAGFPTTFVRVFNCNLRCSWCDTKYSYAPYQAEYYASIQEIVDEVQRFGNHYICLTGGEPLMHRDKSLTLVRALAHIQQLIDIHIETNGAIYLQPFAELRRIDAEVAKRVRFVMDYKLSGSGEKDRMDTRNFDLLDPTDEIKFVIATEEDFIEAVQILRDHPIKALALFSPVWESMPPARLVELMLEHRLVNAKLNLQIHKIIWDPAARGV